MVPNRNSLIALVFLIFAVAFTTAPEALGGNSSRATPMKFVGTFVADSGRLICTYNSDGTVFLVTADMFTEDMNAPTGGRKTTPWQGAWRKVGDNKIQVTLLSFATEPFGHNYNANGLIFKTKWLAEFDDPVKGVSPGYTVTNVVLEGYLPNQNPNTDTPVFSDYLPDGSAYRLLAE